MEKIPSGDSLLEKKKEWKEELVQVLAWKNTTFEMAEEIDKDYDNLDSEGRKEIDDARSEAVNAQDDYKLICSEIKKDLINNFFSGDYYLAEEEFEKIEAEAMAELRNKDSDN